MMRLLFLLAGVLVFGCGYAQNLHLEDAINIALKNSLDIQIEKNNLEISKLNNSFGIAGGLPVVSGNASNTEQITDINQRLSVGKDSIRYITRNGASTNNLSAGVTATFLLYNGMRVRATRRRLEQLQTQTEEYLNGQIQNTMAVVMTSYYDVIRQQSYIKTINQSIEVARQKLSIVKTQQNVGLANNANLFQAQLDLNNLLQSQQSQQLVIDQTKTELLRLLTLRPDSTINIEDTIVVDNSVTLAAIFNNLQNNYNLQAASDQIKINALIEKEVAAQRYPSIRANTGYSYSRNQASGGQVLLNQSNGPLIGLSVSVPIYNGSIYKRQQKIAEINTHNAQIQKSILERDYSSGAVKAFLAYSSNLIQLETAQQNLGLANQLVNLVLQRFQLRQATIIELTQAQQSFETSSYSLINLRYAAKASEIELKRLTNQLKF